MVRVLLANRIEIQAEGWPGEGKGLCFVRLDVGGGGASCDQRGRLRGTAEREFKAYTGTMYVHTGFAVGHEQNFQ